MAHPLRYGVPGAVIGVGLARVQLIPFHENRELLVQQFLIQGIHLGVDFPVDEPVGAIDRAYRC